MFGSWDLGFWEVTLLAVGLFAGLGLLASLFERVTVFEYQQALLFRHGRFERLLDPGSYWTVSGRSKIDVLDVRPVIETIPGQEILSQDGVTLKVSLLIESKVVDARQAVLESVDHRRALYARAQTALRSAVGDHTIEAVLASRAQLGEQLTASITPAATALGIELLSVTVKDIMFPGPLKDAFSMAARARQESRAALERARGEQAALRSLANAARLLDKNPRLYELRLLQTAAAGALGQMIFRLAHSRGLKVVNFVRKDEQV
ncbi:MAG: SPFH domain-containing protein, partial [Acidobacteriota bacterium]